MTSAFHRFSIKAILSKGWPILFWSWMLGVSVWIDSATIVNPNEEIPAQKFSRFIFNQMVFEQRIEEGALIHVVSDHAVFDGDQRLLKLDQPSMFYQKAEGEEHIQAVGNEGVIHVAVTAQETGLPSEFSELVLTGNAKAEGENWSVESSELIFNNTEKRLLFPKESTFTQKNAKSKITGFFYDLTTKKMMPIPKNPN